MPEDLSDLDLGATIRGFRVGQRLFNRYVLKEILGRGGMGVVWRAFDEQLERDVALKFLPELVTFDEQSVADLKRETRKSQELRHHHIVQVYDFVSDKQNACISMEYVDGPTLSALKARKPDGCLEVNEISQWIEQLCEALAYAHSKARVVHRDLKPANLMVNGKGELKITDFGIARSVSDSVSMLTMARGTSGTLVYMSPQQLDGERSTHLDDIYSVGATIYELLTSKPPFYSGNIDRQIHEKAPTPVGTRRADFGIQNPSPIPTEWERTIALCLSKDPTQRPQSASEVAKGLGLRVASYAVPGLGALPARTETTVKSNRRRLAMASAFVALLLLALVGYFATQLSKAPEQKAPPQVAQMPMSSPAPSISPVTTKFGIPEGSNLGFTELSVSATPDPSAPVNLVLRMTMAKRPSVMIDHTKVTIRVFFYDTIGDHDIKLTDADVSYEWLTPSHDWAGSAPETLAVTYLRPKGKTYKEERKYLGYIVRLYYQDKLEDVRADPARLLNLFPAPQNLAGNPNVIATSTTPAGVSSPSAPPETTTVNELLRKYHEFLDRGETATAWAYLQDANQLDPNNAEVNSEMAKLRASAPSKNATSSTSLLHQFDGVWVGKAEGSAWTSILTIKNGSAATCVQQDVNKLPKNSGGWSDMPAPDNKAPIVWKWSGEARSVNVSDSTVSIYWADWKFDWEPKTIPRSIVQKQKQVDPGESWLLTANGNELVGGKWKYHRKR